MSKNICNKHLEPKVLIGSGKKARQKCKTCNTEYQRNWFLQNKNTQRRRVRKNRNRAKDILQNIVKKYLEGHPCIVCGEKDYVVLTFDHKDPKTKIYGISEIVCGGFSVKTLLEEINKCDVKCFNCHARHTASQFQWDKLTW